MELVPLISIPVIYFLIAFIKPYFSAKLPFNLCAICVAVSLSWLILLILWVSGTNVSVTALAILLGMSLTGLMYQAEAFYKTKDIKNFWLVRLVIVVGGFYGIYQFLQQKWSHVGFILIITILLVAIASLLFQSTTHTDVLHEQAKSGREKSLIKRLDDCC